MRTRAAVLVLTTLGMLCVPDIAVAKGASRATIRGPGLDNPMKIGATGGEAIYRLAELAGFYPAVFETEPSAIADRPPVKALGPRYDIAYLFEAPGRKSSVIHQDLYPFAQSGPVTHVEPGQPVFRGSTSIGGWYQAEPELLRFLVNHGLPADMKGSAESMHVVPDEDDAAAGDGSRVLGSDSDSAPGADAPWALVAMVAVTALALAGAWWIASRRRRVRSAHV